MSSLTTIETKLNDAFKGLPPLPDKSKEALVKVWPWIALVFGVLQLFAAWALWGLTSTAERLNDLVELYTARSALSGFDKGVIYLGIIVLIVDAVILLKAYPHLKTRNVKGWELLFLGSVINVAYAVLQIFISGRGFGNFLFSLLGSAIGFYLLFQVKAKYKA